MTRAFDPGMAHNTIIELQARMSSTQFMNLKTGRRLACHIQALTVTLGSEKYMVGPGRTEGLYEIGVQCYLGDAIHQLRRAEILAPFVDRFRRTENSMLRARPTG
jgi:hypothetical protein